MFNSICVYCEEEIMKNHRYNYNYTMAERKPKYENLKVFLMAIVGLFTLWIFIVMVSFLGGNK